MSPPCAGFIIFSQSGDKVLLISTHKNIIGFPKGKKEKDEDSITAAYRELHEETGLTANMIKPVQGLYVDEMSIRGNYATRLYIGILSIENPQLEPIDHGEIASVYFEDIGQAMIQLMPKRKKVLASALSLINEV